MVDLAQLHREFVTEKRYSARLSEVTLRGYEQGFALLREVMPDIGVDRLTTATMTEFFRRLETRSRIVGRGIKKMGVKKSTIATYRSKLSQFFGWLERRKYLKANPFTIMEYPDVQFEDRKFLGRSEIHKIFAALAFGIARQSTFLQRRNLAIFAMLLYTGIRKGELLQLRVFDLETNRSELTVRAETSKSRLRRTIPISTELMKMLRDYLIERSRRKVTTPYLFVSSGKDGRLTGDGLKHLVEAVRKASGVRFHVHQFRHTFAVNVLNSGSDIAKLKQLLGHRDIRMTATYLRCLPTSAMRGDLERLALDTLV